MLRLIIVDDERIIRETISQIIDWESLGITVIGVCKNGLEAYDMILDEYPDIVLTDIKMPGLSGLQLIQQLSSLDLNIEFVILSGYSDFTLVTEAMKYGVQHYLLKPCSEEELVSTMKQVIVKYHQKCSLKQIQSNYEKLVNQFEEHMIFNVIYFAIYQEKPFEKLLTTYTPYINLSHNPYTLCQVNGLNETTLDHFLSVINEYRKEHCITTPFYYIYVKDQLNIFFQSKFNKEDLYTNLKKSFTFIDYKLSYFDSFSDLLKKLYKAIKQYDLLYILKDQTRIPIYNYMNISEKCKNFQIEMPNDSNAKEEKIKDILSMFSEIEDIELLKSTVCNLLLKHYFSNKPISSSDEILQVLSKINLCNTHTQILTLLEQVLSIFYCRLSTTKYKEFIERILDYISLNYANPKLTLKWIAENYLYMNVDYVSKQFLKQIGIKFSTYLTNLRIEKAKQLLLEQGIDKIYEVAQLTGFGNNPQYFSQTFKKNTGLTPSEFITQNHV